MKLNGKYEHDYQVRNTIIELNELRKAIYKDFIVDTSTLNNHFFNLSRSENYILRNRIFEILSEWSGKINLWDILKTDLFIYDKEWSDWRNKELKFATYHKYQLHDDYVSKLIIIVDDWINETYEQLSQLLAKEEQKKIDKENRKNMYSIKETIILIRPDSQNDGWFDGVIVNNNTKEEIRYIAKNIFDVGFVAYPHRFGGSKDAVKTDSWTEEEKCIYRWIREFSPFKTDIRM